jgi:thiosulfate/3-mercaptopyruvate sulfurtransferase
VKKRIALVLFVLMGVTLLTGCGQKASNNSVGSSSTASVAIEDRGYINNDLLVSTDWVNEHLSRDDVFIIDARGDDAYSKGHIPGAISVTWQQFANMEAEKGKGFANLLEPEKLTPKFQAFGIDDNKTIVVYADPTSGWGEDGRLVWMFRMAGLNDSKILDGGWPAWVNGSYTTTREAAEPTPCNYVITDFNDDMNATTDWICEHFDEVVILDSRSQKEYDGATDYGEPRGGHIAGAISMPWTVFFNLDSTVKSEAEIEQIMSEAGIEKSDLIVTYCTSGIRSAYSALVLRMAGYEKAKNYDGSINEWGAIDELPME